MWPYLIADDVSVDRFIVRIPNTRPSEREQAALDEWLKTDKPFHCLRDHPYHSTQPLVPGLIGGIPSKLTKLFEAPWAKILQNYKSATAFLQDAVWSAVKDLCWCHDSVSCKKWPGTQPFPVLRKASEFVGQRFDSNDQAIDHDEAILWNQTFIQPDCVFLKNTGFTERAIKSLYTGVPSCGPRTTTLRQ